jgi:trans-aconitate methyltransferase
VRQSIYAYQEPPIDLARGILSLAGLSGHEVVADIGCGNGIYLAELSRRRHAGPVVGAVAIADRLKAAPGAVFRVTTHSGCLVCA